MTIRAKRVKVGSLVPLVSLVILLAILTVGFVSAAPPGGVPPGLARAAAAQERHTDALLAHADVVGTAVGLAVDGQPVVKVYTKSANPHGLPADLDGVPVEVEQTGELVAQDVPQGIGESSGTERLIQVRKSLYCTVGTMGMLLTDASHNVYALSNAHVYANQGSKTYGGAVTTGDNGDRILQPGRVDMEGAACGTPDEITAATIGHLWAYALISFSRSANNQVDAAIAKLTTTVENSTPGPNSLTPSTSIQAAAIGMPVQKYGRTTKLTQGTVSGINATVLIQYDTGVARFVGQVVVGGPFSDSGDSGSLIMTVSGNHPVALLFAGSSSTTIGNPIDKVLAKFPGLSIVGP
jgi:hypothetical protein